jgi:hypothetical protein
MAIGNVSFESWRGEKYVIFEGAGQRLMRFLRKHRMLLGRNAFRTKATKPLQSQSWRPYQVL